MRYPYVRAALVAGIILSSLLPRVAAARPVLHVSSGDGARLALADYEVSVPESGARELRLSLTPADAASLSLLTSERLGKPLALSIGGVTVMLPVVKAPTLGRDVAVTFADQKDFEAAKAALLHRVPGP